MTHNQYDILAAEFAPEELADGYVFPAELSKTEQLETEAALAAALTACRQAMTPEVRLKGALLQLRFQMEDYLVKPAYQGQGVFGGYLKRYIDCLKKTRAEFAREIDITPSELSQYINHHRRPPQNVLIRLELHSRGTIPATFWYRLLEKECLHELETNMVLREDQAKYVKRATETDDACA